jgi:AraC-like DNA-binding protein
MNLDEINFVPDIKYAIFRKCTPAWRMPKQECDTPNLGYIVKGSAHYIIDGNHYDASVGDLVCMPVGCIRSGTTPKDNLMHCYATHFLLKKSLNETTRLPFPIVSHVGIKPDIIHLFNQYMITWLDKQPGYQMKIRGLFLLIVQRFYELIVHDFDSQAGDPRIKRVTDYLANHFASKLTVKQMAEMIELNSIYFGELFKKETGLSMNRYLMQIRIRNAENLLASGEYKVIDVAAACGFSDEIHFYKNFKLLTGLPPSHYIPKNQ